MRLKPIVLGMLLLMGVAGQAAAQNIHLGLEAGGNLANFSGSDIGSLGPSLSSRIGLIGGAFLQVDLGPVFAIELEGLYSQKGTDFPSGDSINLDYVEIPLLLKYYFPVPGIKPNVFFGGALAFNTLAKAVSGGSSSDFNGVKSSDVGLIGGVGLEIQKFSINARYELGMSDLGDTTKIQNGTLSVMVGYAFM